MKIKIKPEEKVVVKVKGFRYGTNGDPSPRFNKTYKGTYEKVLNKISENHSYGYRTDEKDNEMTVEELVDAIEGMNGDGCDQIDLLTITTDKKTWKVIEEDEEEIDCDWD